MLRDMSDTLAFVEVVERGSFTAAAESFRTSKARISKKVQDLEQRLGVKPLHRTTRNIRLTEAGSIYFERCRDLGRFRRRGECSRVEVFQDDDEVISGFQSILRPGHTPGHSSIGVESGGKKLVLRGDITHGDVVQFEQPEVTIEFDVDRSGAVRSRRQTFAEAIAEGHLVAGAHIAFLGIGNVLRA